MSVLSAKIHKQNPLYLSSPTTAGVMSNTVVPVSLLGITSYFCRHPVSVIVKTSRQKNCLICFACLHFFFFRKVFILVSQWYNAFTICNRCGISLRLMIEN